jgi:hypothetical protein
MNVSSIGGCGMPNQAGRVSSSDFRARMEQGMAPVAQLFGTDTSQLMSDVQASGGSLADYAASKGVSKDALIAAIKQGLQSNAPNGAQLSDTQLTNLANRIANHKPGDRPQGPPPSSEDGGFGGVGQLSNSSQIKTDLDKLIEDLKSSTTSTATTTSSDSSGSSGSNGVDALVELLSRIDQQL